MRNLIIATALVLSIVPAHAKEMSMADRKLESWEAYKAGYNAGVDAERIRIVNNVAEYVAAKCGSNREKKSDRLPMMEQ